MSARGIWNISSVANTVDVAITYCPFHRSAVVSWKLPSSTVGSSTRKMPGQILTSCASVSGNEVERCGRFQLLQHFRLPGIRVGTPREPNFPDAHFFRKLSGFPAEGLAEQRCQRGFGTAK